MTLKFCLAIMTIAVLSATRETLAQYCYPRRYSRYSRYGSTPSRSMARRLRMLRHGSSTFITAHRPARSINTNTSHEIE